MDKKQMTHFSEKLEKMSDDILSGADKTISEMTDHSDNYPDPTDRAAAESDRSIAFTTPAGKAASDSSKRRF